MVDSFTPGKRSEVMAAVKSRGNKATETRLAALFREHRIIGWRRGQRLEGNPDFLFRRERVAVFVDGCFWHGCPRHLRMPQANREYWQKKIERNVRRDRRVNRLLRQSGWRVVRIWEHSLREPLPVIRRVRSALSGRGGAG